MTALLRKSPHGGGTPYPELRLLIADHRDIFAASLAQALTDLTPHTRWAHLWEEAEAALAEGDLSLLILNLAFEHEGHRGVDILDHARRAQPHLPVAVVSTHASMRRRREAERMGAAGYVHLDLPKVAVCQAVQVVAGGGRWFAETPGVPPGYTEEEMAVLRLLRQGEHLPGIRTMLHRPAADVLEHIGLLCARLGTDDTRELVHRAASLGLFDVPPWGAVIQPWAACRIP
jgi:DNA-binding NarL/FixJ family response regulator